MKCLCFTFMLYVYVYNSGLGCYTELLGLFCLLTWLNRALKFLVLKLRRELGFLSHG